MLLRPAAVASGALVLEQAWAYGRVEPRVYVGGIGIAAALAVVDTYAARERSAHAGALIVAIGVLAVAFGSILIAHSAFWLVVPAMPTLLLLFAADRVGRRARAGSVIARIDKNTSWSVAGASAAVWGAHLSTAVFFVDRLGPAIVASSAAVALAVLVARDLVMVGRVSRALVPLDLGYGEAVRIESVCAGYRDSAVRAVVDVSARRRANRAMLVPILVHVVALAVAVAGAARACAAADAAF
jgi:hypothetical protein